MTSGNIDFVVTWVDGSNSAWREQYTQNAVSKGDDREIRFRDWDLLRYWFRSVEKYTPWVRKIHFITSGELPDWIDINHPKLNWVRHNDYIPSEYLPTFNSNTIELNIHRIKDLSEKFVLFNDDFFITKPLPESRFFENELPCDAAVMTAKPSGGGIIHIAINNLEVLDKHFDKHQVMKQNFSKWFSPKYKQGLINNILLYPWREFSGFIEPHIPYAFLKATLSRMWDIIPAELGQTSECKFRTNDNINQWLIRHWQLCEGRFYPKDIKANTYCMDITDDSYQQIYDFVRNQKYEMICLNDTDQILDFDRLKNKLREGFELILPEKSSFETT